MRTLTRSAVLMLDTNCVVSWFFNFHGGALRRCRHCKNPSQQTNAPKLKNMLVGIYTMLLITFDSLYLLLFSIFAQLARILLLLFSHFGLTCFIFVIPNKTRMKFQTDHIIVKLIFVLFVTSRVSRRIFSPWRERYDGTACEYPGRYLS